MVDFVFCAVDMKKDEIKALEEAPARPVRNNDNDGEKRDRKPRAPRKAAKPSYDLPETQEGFSLADFLGEDFDINNF